MVAPAANWLPPGLGTTSTVADPTDQPLGLGQRAGDLGFWRDPPAWRDREDFSSTAALFLCIVVGTAVLAIAAMIAGGSGSPDFTLGMALGIGAGVVPYALYILIRACWSATDDGAGRRRRMTQDEWQRIFGPRRASNPFGGAGLFGSSARADETSWQSASYVPPNPEQELQRAYGILGVAAGASRREVRIAYHRLAHRYHPDKVANADEHERLSAEQRMKELNAAFSLVQQRRTP